MEAITELNPSVIASGIEPSSTMASKAEMKGFSIENNISEKAKKFKNYADLVVCFEVTEHVHDTLKFMRSLTSFCKPGGKVLITSLTCDGFDIKTLWKQSKSVYPPHHINFLSKEGYKALFNNSGLENVKIITPGKLDIDIVRNFTRENNLKIKIPDFLHSVIEDENLSKSFQEFLENNKLSSHIWVFGTRN